MLKTIMVNCIRATLSTVMLLVGVVGSSISTAMLFMWLTSTVDETWMLADTVCAGSTAALVVLVYFAVSRGVELARYWMTRPRGRFDA